jgi:hypothetical protein
VQARLILKATRGSTPLALRKSARGESAFGTRCVLRILSWDILALPEK